MKLLFKFIGVILLTLALRQDFYAAIITSVNDGNWSNPATWDAGVPGVTDDVIIANGHTITLDSNADILSLTLNGALIIGNDATSRTLVINGITTVNAGGSLTVGAFDITHSLTFRGNIINDGVFNLYQSAGQTAEAFLNGTFSISGSQTPRFAKTTFVSGTVTTNTTLDIDGAVVIENSALFDAGALTHTVAGNWTEIGTGALSGNSTIRMDAPFIQSITSSSVFHHLIFSGGGTGVLGANIIVNGNFTVENNTDVQTSQQHNFYGNFTINDGSRFEAGNGRVNFISGSNQTIQIGTTNGSSNTTFYQAWFQTGGIKTIQGDMTVTNRFQIDNGVTVTDAGNTQTIIGNGYFNGTCNFNGTVVFKGGTHYDTGDFDFTVGTAKIIVKGYTYIGDGNIMRVNGNMTIMPDDGNHIGFIINNNAELRGNGTNSLTVNDNSSLYIRGINNFPTTFGSVVLQSESYVRYDASLSDQTIYPGVTYGRLYLSAGTSKTAGGNLDINSHLYVYNATEFRMLNFNHTLAGNIYNSDESYGNGSVSATSNGTLTLDAPDASQIIYTSGTGTYTFHNLVMTSSAPTEARYKYIQDNIIVNGNFTATNTGGDNTNRLYVNIYENTITGGSAFGLGAYVWLLTSGTNTFQNSMTSFSGAKTLNVNSCVRFERQTTGSNQNIPGGFTYGSIELSGSNQKIPQANLDVNGDFSVVGGVPVLTDNSRTITVAGNWNMSLETTNLTGSNVIRFDGTDQTISTSKFSYVYFSNGGIKTINGTLDILNNLNIETNVTVIADERNIYIEGNWSESGTGHFVHTNGTIFFDGTTANQTVTTTATTNFFNVTINKPSLWKTLTLNAPLNIDGTLDFTEDNAVLNLNGRSLYVARDFYFREGCTFTTAGGKVFFDGNDIAQLIRNFNTSTIVFSDVEFAGTAVKRLYDNSFRFQGDVTINNSTLDGQSWDHYVEGDWLNSGIFRHSATMHFDGANPQSISQSGFGSVIFEGGNFVKTLTGNINLTGNLTINNATLDAGAGNYDITLDNNWYNNASGSFIARQGSVIINGDYSYIFTGESNLPYSGGAHLTSAGGTKSFYNLTIQKNTIDHYIILRGDLHVANNLNIQQGDFRQSYDPNNYGINTITIGGDFISKGQFRDNNYGDVYIELNPAAGSHIFDPGNGNTYSIMRFNGAGSSAYTFNGNLTLYNNRPLTIFNGTVDLNAHAIVTTGANGDITLLAGSLEVDSAATIDMGAGSTFTNSGGNFILVGHADYPASLVSTSGTFTFLQTAGTIFAQYYRIQNTTGNGFQISGGNVDGTRSFANGSFSGGTGTAYLTLTGIDLGGDRTLPGVSFNSGPVYNVQRISGNGALIFENAIGTLAGENYDNDNGNPGTLINWTYPGAVRWTGLGDGTHWNDANNWGPVGIPTDATTVILDHTNVSAAYTVSLSTLANGSAKSLIINSGANPISLVLDSRTLNVSGDITISAGSVLTQTNTGDIITVGGSWSNEGTFNEGTSTVIFNPVIGTHTISTKGFTDPFYNLTINGSDGTNVISTNLDVNGDVNLLSGTLNAGNYTINVAGNWSRSGGMNFIPGTGTVNFDNTGNQDINGGEFFNLSTSSSGTKNVNANIDVAHNLTIGMGTVLNGSTNILYVGRNWINQVGHAGFTQTGAGTVIFDGRTYGQDISLVAPTTFNNIIINGTQTKYTRNNININGNLIITDAALYIVDGTIIDGTGPSNSLNMSGGRIYVNGANNFPSNFETINLSAGTVDYYANIDQTIYPTSYYALMVRRINAGNMNTKTLTSDITVNNSLYIYDNETLLNVDNHTINLFGNLDLATDGRQINWGPNGTLIHFGEYWIVDQDIDFLNNVTKKNRGYMRVHYKSLNITGDISILDDAYLQQDTVNIVSTGVNKSFTVAATAYVYSYNPITVGPSTGRKAFPVNFAQYNLHKNSRVYIAGTVGNQTIYTVPVYGNLYLYTNAEILMTLDGHLNVDGELRMYDAPTLMDAGYNINIAGSYVDIRKYSPTGATIMTFDGEDQQIVDAGSGATIFDMKNVVFAGTGQKSLHYNGDDWYNVTGNLTVLPGVTVYIPRRLDFSGAAWNNNGIFNHTAYVVNFNGTAAQSINPGIDNDFYAVSFSNAGIKTFITNGIDVNDGTFTINSGTNVNMNNLTHFIASERITNNGGIWATSNANFIFDRNGTQYLPAMTCKDITFRRYDQWDRVRYLEGAINIDDLNIEQGTQLRCSANADESTPAFNVSMTGNFNNDGYLYAWGNTFAFESDNTDAKYIKQGNGSFDFVTFNQNVLNQELRTYSLTEETRFYEDMVVGFNATLDLNGQILRLGNDDENEPVEPQAEQHQILSGGILDVDAGASLFFSCRDLGNPVLDVNGTLRLVGTNGNNATVTSTDWYSNLHRIDININNGGQIDAQYYLMKYIVADGLYIDANATLHPVNNLSNGTWSDIPTSGGRYLYCNADVTDVASLNNLSFNYNGTPSVGTHFNIKRDAGSIGVLTLGGNASGLLAGAYYEADPTGQNNTATSLIEWPAVSEAYWTGNINTDWFNPGNWAPNIVPTALIDAVIPIQTNNPVIHGSDAICKDLKITTGFLSIRDTRDLNVNGDVYIGTGTNVGIMAVEDPACNINVTGSWTRAMNSLFLHGNGLVNFIAGGGSISIDPGNSAFGNIAFNGGATFMLNRSEIFIDNTVTILNGTVQPIVNNYLLHIKGNYTNTGGIYDNTIQGTILFDGNNNQLLTNADFWNVTVDGTDRKTTSGTCAINGNFLIKNALFTAGNPVDFNNNVTIEAPGGIEDGGFTHTFSGTRWTGTGSYTGSGIIEFDRDGNQYIQASKFNTLVLKNNGSVDLEGNVTMTGNLSIIEPNMYLNVRTHQITSTSGTASFLMDDTRRIYVRGNNNFPTGFASYNLHKNSYTMYDGAVSQIIAPIPVVYGRLYLDNSDKIAGGHLDINGILYFYDDASLDVTTNHYRINIEGDWYNTAGAAFNPRQGEVVFDGNDPITNMYIYEASKLTNPFYRLTVNKGDGELRCLWTDVTVQNNLRVLNGILYQSQTMYVGGDMSALSGSFRTAGTYYLNRTSGTSNLQVNNSVLNNLTINSGAIYYLQDDFQMNGQFNLIAGTFDAGGKLVRMGDYGEVNQISGVYTMGAGGVLKLPDYGTLRVNSGGEMNVVGSIDQIATVTNHSGRYYFNIESGGTIRARNYMFEYMAENGIYVKDGAIIDNDFNFSYGTFTNPAAGGNCLRIENNQSFTETGGNPIVEVSFPLNPGGGAANVMKTIAVGGTIDFKDYTGEFAGENFDNDPSDLINWISVPFIMWTGNIDNDWYKIGNWEPAIGPDRIPTIDDDVIIGQRLNQPLINIDGAVAKSIELMENAILTLNSSAAADTTLTVAGDLNISGMLIMSTCNDSLAIAGNWNNMGAFFPGTGSVIFNSRFGIKTLDNLNDNFHNLHINTLSEVQLLRNLTVNNTFLIKNGIFDLTADNRIFTVRGNFYNYDGFISRNARLVMAGTIPVQVFNPGLSAYYNVDISTTTGFNVRLTNNDLILKHNLNITEGNLLLNGRSLYLGDAVGIDVLTLTGGSLQVNGDAHLLPADNASIEVNGGNISLLGTDEEHPAYIASQSGNYAFNINNGGEIRARFYHIQNLDINGIFIKPGALINATDNFSYGFFRNGTPGGCYITSENDLSLPIFDITNVYFHEGADYNVRRLTGNGVLNFIDAQGVRAGYLYEIDDPANGQLTGRVTWTYTRDMYQWTGNINTDWNVADNWDVPFSVDPSGHAVPNATAMVLIPNVSAGSGNNPTLGLLPADPDGTCFDMIIENGGHLTLDLNKNLDINNTVTVQSGASFTVQNGSLSQINVGDSWLFQGLFLHGNSSTVVMDAPTAKILTLSGNNNFYNLSIASPGNAIYTTGSSVEVDGDFNISTGTFSVSNPLDTLIVGRNFSNSSNFVHGNGLVLFDGSNQSISNTGTGNLYRFTCAGNSIKSILSNLTVEHDILIQSGVSLNAGNSVLTVNGDWVNRGIFVASTSTVVFSGAGTQLLDNYNPEAFYNFTVNNSAATFPQILLYSDLNLTGTDWTMTDGVVESTDESMLTAGDNIILIGGNTPDAYVIGPLTKTGTADFTFPIGDGLKFARLGISGIATEASFTARYFEAAYSDIASVGAGVDHVSGYEHWTLYRNSGTAQPYVRLFWEDGAQSGIDNLGTLIVAEYETAWENRNSGGTSGTVSVGSIISGIPVSAFGPVTFASTNEDNPLNAYTRWTGAMSTVWNNPNNWTLGIPTSTMDAFIPSAPLNQPIVQIDAVTRKLTVELGASLDIEPLQSLTTEGRFIINGSFTLHSDENGNASLINNSTITYGPSCNVLTELYLTGFQYHHVSSPTVSTHSDRFKVDPVLPYYNHNFYSYNETETDADWASTDWVEFNGNMETMTGYTTWFDRNPTILINRNNSGDFNTGDKSSLLTYTGASAEPVIHRGWNLVGNPYPSHIDWTQGDWVKNNVYNSIYFWNGTNYSYFVASGLPQDNGLGVNNGSAVIAPMQGYFVKVIEPADPNQNTTGTLITPENSRTTASGGFWKNTTPKSETDVIRLTITYNNKEDEAAVRFFQGSTSGFDAQFDAYKLFPGDYYEMPMIYSIVNNETFASVNTLPEYMNDLIIPIGIQSCAAGMYTIEIPPINFSKDASVFLEDLYEDKIMDIKSGINYAFLSETGQFNDRFRIRFSIVEILDEETVLTEQPDVDIYAVGSDIWLHSLTEEALVGKVEIFNMTGTAVYMADNTFEPTARIDFINYPAGTYLVKLTNKYGVFTGKVFVSGRN